MKLSSTIKILLATGLIITAGNGCQKNKAGIEEKTKQELINNSLAEEQEILFNEKLAKEREDAEKEKRKNQEIERNNINIDRNASMDGVLKDYEIATSKSLLNNFGSLYINFRTLSGEIVNLPASGAKLAYNSGTVSEITFFLIDKDAGDGALGKTETSDPLRKKRTITMNLYEIRRSIAVIKQEIGIELSIEETLKMAFREEVSHLISNKGAREKQLERENDVLLAKTLPEKFGIIKMYIMFKNIENSKSNLTERSPGYQYAFNKYKALRESVGCNTFADINLQKLYEMVQKVKTGEFS